MAKRRKNKYVKEDSYRCEGGPYQALYLPHPRPDTDPSEHLPQVVPVPPGQYTRKHTGTEWWYEYNAD